MNRRLAATTVLLLAAQGACAPSGKPAPLSANDEKAVRALDAALAKAANAGDAAGMAALYAADAVLLPPNMPLAKGPDAIKQTFGGMMAEATPQLVVTPTKIDGREDLAYTVGTYHITMTPKAKAKGAAETDEGKYVVVTQRQADGGWKIVADVWNSDKPAAPPRASASKPTKKRPAKRR